MKICPVAQDLDLADFTHSFEADVLHALRARRELRLAEWFAAGHHEHFIVGHKAEHRLNVAGLVRGHPCGDQIRSEKLS